MYFDRIERSEVTALLDSIYANVHLLEDVQFLVQYAPQVLPPTVQEASGERIWANILALQEDLSNKREVVQRTFNFHFSVESCYVSNSHSMYVFRKFVLSDLRCIYEWLMWQCGRLP